ncbi:MAG TPA: SDR family NAD(P)-dependent oxidoreductase [Candidatus Hydrogenedentes bacterium]|jgi:GDP-4-dehydro-6-deoxy-D-mannose reductase|nr:SDR family NAD(P)-dependent oxidoreductase [Candidatus Hydrogenedentota bacterium]
MTMRALVTGADGFVGGVLCRHLAQSGWEVRMGVMRAAQESLAEFQCDITDAERVQALVAWAGPVDVVFHLAAVAFVPDSIQEPQKTLRVNVEGTMNLLQSCRAQLPESRFLFVSTSEVYGPPVELPVRENHPLNPQNPYAISKAAADCYCAYVYESTGYDIVRMRPFNHSGPGQSDQFVLSSFARQLARAEAGVDKPLLRVGNLEARRDFLHVDDVVRAYELAARNGAAGEVYNIASGQAVLIRDALDLLLRMGRVKMTVEPATERMRPVEVREVAGSSERLTRATGWMPQRSLEALLTDVLNFWRAQEGVSAP